MKRFRSLLRNRKLEKVLLAEYEWKSLNKEDMRTIPFEREKEYVKLYAAKVMETFAESMFKKSCSKLGVNYNQVEYLFFKQNEQFFNLTRSIAKISELVTHESKINGGFLIDICQNLIVPKCSNIEEIIREIKELSPEEQAEALQLLTNKKIKITVEDTTDSHFV